jgi:hypothetical protein
MIFTVITVILFFLSFTPNVAATKSYNPIDMDSTVGDYSPWAFATVIEVIPEWTWGIDIDDNGEDVLIRTRCWAIWEYPTGLYPYQTLNGHHEFEMWVYYPDDTTLYDYDSWEWDTDSSDDTMDSWLECTVYDAMPEDNIYVKWRVDTFHVESEYPTADTEDGYIHCY